MTPIIIDTIEPPIGSVIFLHGLGADGFDFKSIFGRSQFNKIRFILPHAPYQPVTINQGMEMRAWYDLYDLSLDKDEDELILTKDDFEDEEIDLAPWMLANAKN